VFGHHAVGFRARTLQDAVSFTTPVLNDSLSIREELISTMHGFREQLTDLFDQIENLGAIDDA